MKSRQGVLCDQKTLCVTDSIALQELKRSERIEASSELSEGKYIWLVCVNKSKYFAALIVHPRTNVLLCGWMQVMKKVIKELPVDVLSNSTFLAIHVCTPSGVNSHL